MKIRTKHELRHFNDASLAALEALQSRYGMALWMVTSGDDESIVLHVRGSALDTQDEKVQASLEHYCRIAAVMGPKIEPAVDEASMLAGTDTARRLKIGAYIGLPLRTDDGTLVGTLCAIDPERQPDTLREAQPELENVARLLATALMLEMRHDTLIRRVERAEARLVDADTGLYSREGWLRLVEAEDKRCERYDRPAGALVVRIDEDAITDAGELVADRTRMTDVAARIGDDKLALLVLETKPDALPKVAERIERELTARGIGVAIGYAVRDPMTGFDASIIAAEPRHVH